MTTETTTFTPSPERAALLPAAERRALGKRLRDTVSRGCHADWSPPPARRDPVEILIETGKGRIPALLPIRYGRMSADAFAFLRGAAAIMAADLATIPATGLLVQAGGDSHLMNFGSFL